MAVVKGVCTESMAAAQEEIKNSPNYIVNGEVAVFCHILYLLIKKLILTNIKVPACILSD